MNDYQVDVFHVGRVDVPGPEVYWQSHWAEWLELSFNIVLIRSEEHVVLINTGAPDDLEPINALWKSLAGERNFIRRSESETIVRRLAEYGLRPEDVTHVILTPFAPYTTAGLSLFTNAKIAVSKTGWVHLHTTHKHPHDQRWSMFTPELLASLVTDAWDRVVLLEDEDELLPGIRTWFAGTHHRHSLGVEIDTPHGTVVTSDAFLYYDNVEKDIPIGIIENMQEGIVAYERIRRTGDHIVSLYDPQVFERYPGGVVAR
jgi:hypothetical protein